MGSVGIWHLSFKWGEILWISNNTAKSKLSAFFSLTDGIMLHLPTAHPVFCFSCVMTCRSFRRNVESRKPAVLLKSSQQTPTKPPEWSVTYSPLTHTSYSKNKGDFPFSAHRHTGSQCFIMQSACLKLRFQCFHKILLKCTHISWITSNWNYPIVVKISKKYPYLVIQ